MTTMEFDRPIVFFDIESTGLNIIHDRIVQVCFFKKMPDGQELTKNYLINPGKKIPQEVIKIHGIKDSDVAKSPKFEEVGLEIFEFIGESDLAGFNLLKFDVPMLVEEFLRIGIDFELDNRQIIDIQTIYHKMEPRNLAAAYQFYCNQTLNNAHDAEADTIATYQVFQAQMSKYSPEDPTIKAALSLMGTNNRVDLEGRIIYDDNGIETFNFGKHKGKSVVQVFENEPSYYKWIMDGDFPGYTKKVVEKIKLKMLVNKFKGG